MAERHAGARRGRVLFPPADVLVVVVGGSAAMLRLFAMMQRVAPRDLPILLLGETGTGKTAVARAMHFASDRRDRPFVTINCAALPPELAESTLFGQVRGAFTGAHRSVPGIFEQAGGGSVLLDEIGDMPLALQTKLLTVLESGRVRPAHAWVLQGCHLLPRTPTARPEARSKCAVRKSSG